MRSPIIINTPAGPAGPPSDRWFDVTDFGAVADDTTNAGPAFQAAFDAAKTQGGGTIFVPPGDYVLTSGAGVTSSKRIHLIGAGGNATVIRFNVGFGVGFSWFGSAGYVADIHFRGTTGSTRDCLRGLAFVSANGIVERCNFTGILPHAATDAGAVYAEGAAFTMRDCGLYAPGGHTSTSTPYVNCRAVGRVTVERIGTLDAGDFGFTSPRNLPLAWFAVRNAQAAQVHAWSQSVVSFRDIGLDEGARHGIYVDSSPHRLQNVTMHNIQANRPSTEYPCIRVANVGRFTLEDSFFGYDAAGITRDAVYLDDVGVAKFRHVRCLAKADRITATSSVGFLELEDCVYDTLSSAAVKTDTVVNGTRTTL